MEQEKREAGLLALKSVWQDYSDFSAHAILTKAALLNRRRISLITGCLGAILETAAIFQPLRPLRIGEVDLDLLAFLGACFIGVTAYLGRELLGGDLEKAWIQARSIAESLKSQVFIYCAGVDPYHQRNPAQILIHNAESLTNTVKMPVLRRELEEPVPEWPMSPEVYISRRIEDQTRGYYWRRAKELEDQIKKFRVAGLALGIIAVIASLSGCLPLFGASAWVAAITTISTSLIAYFQAGRYEYQRMSYTSTARRLEKLLADFRIASSISDAAAFERLVHSCEAAISIENQGWMAEWLRQISKTPEKKAEGG